jgi:anti-anti-sigma factor
MSLSVKVTKDKANRIILTLLGAIDSEAVSGFEKVVKPLLITEFSAIIFDFAKVTYITSAGLSVMVEAEKSIRAMNKSMFVINMPPQIQKVLSVIAALPSLKIFKTVDELDKYLIYLQNLEKEKNK